MTFIQPKKHSSIFNLLIAFLVVAAVGETFGVIVAYNKTVDLSHNIAAVKAQLDSIGAENTQLSNETVALLGGNALSAVVAQDNLVVEKNPHYFQLDQSWPLASR